MVTNRVTQSDLNYLVAQINTEKGFDAEVVKTSYVPGSYQLDYAYGGVKLVKISSTGGGQTSVSPDGYGTKKQLYTFLRGMLA